jgi:hypothetical protein
MSGGYQSGNYEIFTPQSTKGKYHKYQTEIVMIVSITYDRTGKKIKSAKFYLTNAVLKALGKDTNFVKLGVSGSQVAVIPMDKDDGECYVINRKFVKGEETGMPHINVNALAKYLHLEEGVYTAHLEPGGVVEFNRKSEPSRP